jgi:hypothetical protein
MLENYVCGPPTKTPPNPSGRTLDWRPGVTWDAAGRQLQAYLAQNKQILVISTLNGYDQNGQGLSQYGVDEDAFLCYASARLAGFIWTFGQRFSFPLDQAANIRKLFSLRLGKPLTGELTDATSGMNYRVFERGLVTVNSDMQHDKNLSPKPPIVGDIFFDVFSSLWTSVLAVPKYSGRVFLFGAAVDYGFGRVTP